MEVFFLSRALVLKIWNLQGSIEGRCDISQGQSELLMEIIRILKKDIKISIKQKITHCGGDTSVAIYINPSPKKKKLKPSASWNLSHSLYRHLLSSSLLVGFEFPSLTSNVSEGGVKRGTACPSAVAVDRGGPFEEPGTGGLFLESTFPGDFGFGDNNGENNFEEDAKTGNSGEAIN